MKQVRTINNYLLVTNISKVEVKKKEGTNDLQD